MKIIKRILIGILILIVLLLVVAIFVPREFHFERSLAMKAPRAAIYNQITDFRNWKAWMPWSKYDTAMTMEFGPEQGVVGSWYSWKSEKMGNGKMSINRMTPNDSVFFDMQFEGQPPSTSYFILSPEADGSTKVTWGINGKSSYPKNLMNLLMGSFMKEPFERGLKQLSEQADKAGATAGTGAPKSYTVNEVTIEGKQYVGIRKTVSFMEIGSFIQENMPKIHSAAMAAGLEMAGPPSTLHYSWDEAKAETDMAVVIPVKNAKELADGIKVITLPTSKAVEADYWGAYENSGDAHMAIEEYIKKKSLSQGSPVIEEFITDPMNEPDTAKWLTKIYHVIK